MKIIRVDNFDRETVADRLVAEKVGEVEGKVMRDALQAKFGGEDSSYYYKLVPDDHKLWRGMEELV